MKCPRCSSPGISFCCYRLNMECICKQAFKMQLYLNKMKARPMTVKRSKRTAAEHGPTVLTLPCSSLIALVQFLVAVEKHFPGKSGVCTGVSMCRGPSQQALWMWTPSFVGEESLAPWRQGRLPCLASVPEMCPWPVLRASVATRTNGKRAGSMTRAC